MTDEPAAGREMALSLMDKRPSDPGLADDARAAMTLRAGDLLPREILLERLRDTLPAVMRYLATSL
jgi:hypothetical protein